MSAFLAPIHYRMYDKINVQEDWNRAIAAHAVEAGWGVAADFAPLLGEEAKPLETIIDHGNIHEWLTERIESVEKRYAALVGKVLSTDASRIEALETLAHDFGETRAFASTDALAAYQMLDANTLDGMPCDAVNIIKERSEDAVVWERHADVHSAFWEEADADAAHYARLRKAVVDGLCSKSGFAVSEVEPGTFRLARKES